MTSGPGVSKPGLPPHRFEDPTPPGGELLRVERLVKHFPITSGLLRRQVGQVHAVDGISFSLAAGETLGLVGESGCGKTTTGRMLVKLVEPSSGRIMFKGQDITHYRRRQMRGVARGIQMVFQDPFTSLNRRKRVGSILAEPLRIHRVVGADQIPGRVAELLELVGLEPAHMTRYPHEFSGGQRQRIGIARALALRPQLLILDEPVSALDVSIQAQIVNLLRDLQQRFDLAYIFISHDLSVIEQICDRIALMYLGQLIETGDRDDVYDRPTHPYTQALLSSVPIADPRAQHRDRIVLQGDVPNPAHPPSGCRFRTRCWKAEDVCEREEPDLFDHFGHGHPSACHFAEPRDVIGGRWQSSQASAMDSTAKVERREAAASAREETTS